MNSKEIRSIHLNLIKKFLIPSGNFSKLYQAGSIVLKILIKLLETAKVYIYLYSNVFTLHMTRNFIIGKQINASN